MIAIVTRPDPRAWPVAAEASPAILFQRWHRYDGPLDRDGKLGTADTRLPFLWAVAERIDAVAASGGYRAWHQRFRGALGALGANDGLVRSTVWRLITGTATNPALESGLQLHPLWGIPYLPGSSVRGLLHHFAEACAVERAEAASNAALAAGERPPEAAVEMLLEAASEVRLVFGSVAVERGHVAGSGELVGPETPRSLLASWGRGGFLSPEQAARAHALLGEPASGRLAVYDALPEPGHGSLVEPDVLNPHYPEYYGEGDTVPPSDDQNPRPVFFLAVRSGVRFRFAWRLCPRESALPGLMTDEAIRERVGRWLPKALSTWGAGAKTAAGYGYFEADGGGVESGAQAGREAPAGGGAAPADEPKLEVWEGALLIWHPGNRSLEARVADGVARGGEEELGRLPREVQERLTGGPKVEGQKRRKGKPVRLDLEVRVKGPSYVEIVGVPGGGGEG